MAHPWFDGLDWEALRNREMEPPYKPTISSKMDTANFEEFDDDQSSMPFARNTDKSSVLKCRFSQDTSTDQFSWDMWEWIDDYHADL